MATLTCTTRAALHAAMVQDGFAFVEGRVMRELLMAHGTLSDWDRFAGSWESLELDTYMADGGRYRRRRHGTFTAPPAGPIRPNPREPHFQTIDYNPLNGGVARWFEPIDPAIAVGPSMSAILEFCRSLFTARVPDVAAWHVEVHQFRIEARPGEQGRPTPEGLHRDGVDYVLVLLVNRRNIASGVTTIHAFDGPPLGQFTLTNPFDAALVDDTRVAHGVTPVEAIDAAAPAFRDVLVVTFAATRR